MRVTHRMMAESVSQNLRLNLYRLDRLSNQLASGKVFTKPSQNPVGVSRSMLYKTALNRNEQYRLNTNEARGWSSPSPPPTGPTAIRSAPPSPRRRYS